MTALVSKNKSMDLEIDLRNFLLMLWRRKFLIVFVMLAFVGLVFFFVNSVQPRYTARSLILIENRFDPGPELRALMSNMRVDTTFILSEAEVIKSRTMATRVIDKLGLMNDPEFNYNLRQKENSNRISLLDTEGTSSGDKIISPSFKTFILLILSI